MNEATDSSERRKTRGSSKLKHTQKGCQLGVLELHDPEPPERIRAENKSPQCVLYAKRWDFQNDGSQVVSHSPSTPKERVGDSFWSE